MSKHWLGLLLLVVWIGGSGVAHAAVTAAPDPITIGAVLVGQSGTANTTLSANPTVTITTFDLTAAGCSEFQVTTGVPLTVSNGGGGTKTVTVQLTPTSAGPKSCMIAAKDTGGTLVTFAATGSGIAPVIGVTSASTNFGSVRVANAAVTTSTQTFTLGNSGSTGTTLTISNITFSDASYSLQPPAPSFPITIMGGSSQDVTVQFDPSTAGSHAATMTLTSNDPVTPMKGVGLTGVGTTAVIAAADINFGIINNGATNTQGVTVTNSATSSPGVLTVTSATITDTSGFFSFGTTLGCNGGTNCTFISPLTVTNGTLNVPVRCQPPAAAAGTQIATVTLASDTDSGGDATAQLTCTAGRPNIMVSTNMLPFGSVAVGATSPAQIVTIMNTGNTPLTYSLSKTPNVAQYAIVGCSTSCSIAANSMATFSVTFAPTAIGDLTTRIDLTSNDPDPGEGVFSINATGTGTAPQISVAPATLALAFASTEVGRTSTAQTVTATNTGNTTLTISSATLPTGAADYTIVTGLTGSQTIAPAASVSWTIACKPSAPGARPGTFRIASNSLTGATINVALTCTGEQGVVATTPTSLAFGAVAAGTTKPLTFTLRNTGNVPITGITGVLNNTTIGYQFNPATIPAMLAAGASATLTVTFAPLSGTDGGPATITFAANWGGFGATTTATLALDGDGLSTGYDVSPVALDFGNFRFDTRPQQVFRIINSAQASIDIQTLTFTPDAGTATTELVFTIRRGTTIVTLPQTLNAGQQLDVTVTAQPNNRIGLVSGRVDIHSDLATLPDRRVTLTGNATTAAIAAPMLVDFGPVDIDGPAQTQTILLTNNGTAVLDVTSITRTGSNAAFTVTLPTGVTNVSPTTSLPLQVTYRPTVERPANQPDTMVLVANLTGIAGGPSQAMITVQGHGSDRHLLVNNVEAFPPTFRNPGDTAPVQAVTVQNTGEATLRISGVMVTGTPVWQLIDGSPIDLPGGASHDFQVRFSPEVIGAAPPGQLTIVNNDDARPMAMVTLTGNGIDRNVAFGPPTIDLGYAAVGGKLTVADILSVTNLDPSVAFTIHAIQLDDDSVFHIDNPPAGVELPAAMARSFGITFEPTAEGPFETIAHLYLDQDGVEKASVRITGDTTGAVSVHGGGGCSTGGSAGGGAVLALAALVFCRRRRTVAAAAISIAMLGGAGSAVAEDVVIGVFAPTPATTGTGFQVESPEVGPSGSWVASGVASYATDVLVFDTLDDGQVSADHAIKQRTMVSLGGAYAFLDRFEAGLRLPVYAQQGDAPTASQPGTAYVTPASGTALGDLTIHGKARLARVGAAAFGAAVHVTLPTATTGQFTGVDGPTAGVRGLAAWSPRARLSLSASAGGVLRKTSVYRDVASISQGSGFTWGAGASYRVLDRLWATGEVFGEIIRSGRTELGMNTLALAPVEALAGATYRFRGVSLGVALGRGITDGIGAPDLRGVMVMSYTMGSPELAPLHPYVAPAPDRDRDGDRIVDKLDRCPREPEDQDGFQDGDGCPDPDNDRDGIADARDKCANEPEDKDGLQDDDGCPDSDNDSDGLADARDKCPNQSETINGKDDDDGCPDTAEATGIAVTDQGSPTRAAEDTFAMGRELLQQGKYREACAAFEQSQRLDPQFGTQYNIAGCHEKTGKLATAWNLYRELARSDTNPTRRAKAGELAARLAGRVPRIKLVLAKKPDGVQVYMNGDNANALIGIETPVDFGSYGLVAGATHYRAWRKTIAVTEEGKVITVVIDLEPTP